MKILITGATGLIGKELTNLLLKENHIIHYLTTSKLKIQNRDNYFGFYWNPKEGKIEEQCLDGVDAIIHLAGASISNRWTNSYKQELIESRLLSTNLKKIPIKSNILSQLPGLQSIQIVIRLYMMKLLQK
jgi:NAD dependent epimerase/dehydratase family enzyme